MKITYTFPFLRKLKKCTPQLQKEVFSCVKLLEKDMFHLQLKTHKLKGKLKGNYSCSVNYSVRIIFEFTDADTIALTVIGDHDIYKI